MLEHYNVFQDVKESDRYVVTYFNKVIGVVDVVSEPDAAFVKFVPRYFLPKSMIQASAGLDTLNHAIVWIETKHDSIMSSEFNSGKKR